MVQSKKTILSLILVNKVAIQRFGAKKLGLFGSFVKEKQKSKSDVDLLVVFHKKRKNYKNFIGLNYFLEDLLGREVELVTEESLSPYLKPNILKEVEYVI